MAATLAAMLHYAEFDRAPSNDRRIRVTALPEHPSPPVVRISSPRLI